MPRKAKPWTRPVRKTHPVIALDRSDLAEVFEVTPETITNWRRGPLKMEGLGKRAQLEKLILLLAEKNSMSAAFIDDLLEALGLDTLASPCSLRTEPCRVCDECHRAGLAYEVDGGHG